MGIIRKKANTIFYRVLAIGLVFGGLVTVLAINLYPKLVLVSKSLLYKLETICGCTNHWSFTMHPFIFSFIIFTSLIIIAFIILATVKIFKLKKLTSKFVKSSLDKRNHNLSQKLKKVSKIIGLEAKLVEIKTSTPVVFCYGFMSPKICISEGLVEKLNQAELVAVLQHEQSHLLAYEPLKIFLSKIISSILFFVPAFHLLMQKYQILSELAADEYATQNFTNKAPLASALEKVMHLKEQLSIKNTLAISFFSVVDERVNKLVNDKYTPSLHTFTFKSLLLLVIIFVSVASFYVPVYSADSAIASHADGSCGLSEVVPANECQMSMEVVKNFCSMEDMGVRNSYTVCDDISLD